MSHPSRGPRRGIDGKASACGRRAHGVSMVQGGAEAHARVDSPRTFLAFDFGTRRIGVASGNSVSGTASPLATIAAAQSEPAIAKLVAEWRPDALVVGIPRHPDGAAHDNTRRAERFARGLARFKLPVHEVDERYSSVEAEAAGARDVDAAAAALILEQFLRGRRGLES